MRVGGVKCVLWRKLVVLTTWIGHFLTATLIVITEPELIAHKLFKEWVTHLEYYIGKLTFFGSFVHFDMFFFKPAELKIGANLRYSFKDQVIIGMDLSTPTHILPRFPSYNIVQPSSSEREWKMILLIVVTSPLLTESAFVTTITSISTTPLLLRNHQHIAYNFSSSLYSRYMQNTDS